MSLIKRNSGMSRFFDDMTKDLLDWNLGDFIASNSSMPSVNIKEDDNGFTLEVAAPGLNKEDFNLEINDNVLTISAEQKTENEVKEDKFLRKEFSYQSFKRSFNLSRNQIDENNIKAVYNDGILNITLPKKEEAKVNNTRLIEIG